MIDLLAVVDLCLGKWRPPYYVAVIFLLVKLLLTLEKRHLEEFSYTRPTLIPLSSHLKRNLLHIFLFPPQSYCCSGRQRRDTCHYGLRSERTTEMTTTTYSLFLSSWLLPASSMKMWTGKSGEGFSFFVRNRAKLTRFVYTLTISFTIIFWNFHQILKSLSGTVSLLQSKNLFLSFGLFSIQVVKGGRWTMKFSIAFKKRSPVAFFLHLNSHTVSSFFQDTLAEFLTIYIHRQPRCSEAPSEAWGKYCFRHIWRELRKVALYA